MTLILQSDIALIEQIRKEKNILAKETQRLQSQHRRYLRIQKEYTKIYQQQQRKKYTQERLLAKIQRDERLYRAQIAQLNKSSKKLTRLIKRLEAQKKIQKNRYRAYPERGRLPWPVTGHVIKKFGKYKHPKFDIYVINKGIDILAPEGRVVKAVSPGKVVYADWFKGYGMLVMIDHGRGLYSLYAHLSDILVRKNQHVTTGTPVGRVGQTGFASRPNLHFELRVDGQPVDPLVWLRKG
jgi:murein DD-endopeptidase MepM/ murein hydrolase activator NlpD